MFIFGSVCLTGQGGTCLRRGGTYPEHRGGAVHTLDGVPTLDGMVPTLNMGVSYLGLGGGVPTLNGGEGTYLGWWGGGTGYAAGGTPLAASRRRTFLFTIIKIKGSLKIHLGLIFRIQFILPQFDSSLNY